MDMVGRKIEKKAATQWRIANSNVLLNRYGHQQWDNIEELMNKLPDEDKKRAKPIIQERRNIANTCLKSALDATDTASRQMYTGTTLRRHTSLRISGFKQEV